MTVEEASELPAGEREDLSRRQDEVLELAQAFVAEQGERREAARESVQKAERKLAEAIVGPALKRLADQFGSEKLRRWLERAKRDIVEDLGRFQERGGTPAAALIMGLPLGGGNPDPFLAYQINVVVDNSRREAPPVVVERSPNYKSLFGVIQGVYERAGRVTTDFTRIRSGSLLRANGGYLVLNLMEAAQEPLVWKELKRTLKSGHLEYHMYDPFGVFATSALRPESIPLDVKLVVVGSPLVYHLLQLYDEDFPEIFKVKVELADEMDRGEDAMRLVGRLVRKMAIDGVGPFDAAAVAELVRAASRVAEDKRKITAQFNHLSDLARESAFWARKSGAAVVGAEHVRRALEEKVYRSDLIAAKVREMIADGTLRVGLDGDAVGQVNGLAVAQLGDYAFGRPSRVTAVVGAGAAGIVNVERESRLSGRTFDKAMLILEGYLRGKYASLHPLALSASVAMEQSYGMIEGDSASVAELACLLSALAGLPLRQDVAVTGSVDQFGRVQAVGGVNEKIEGFFDVCRERGLTGRQGVCLPAANVKNLVLRPDVVAALREGRFHLWAVEDVDQALELLTGVPAGTVGREGTLHGRVDRRLRELLNITQEQRPFPLERGSGGFVAVGDGPRDPRPHLPGGEG